MKPRKISRRKSDLLVHMADELSTCKENLECYWDELMTVDDGSLRWVWVHIDHIISGLCIIGDFEYET